MKRSWRFPVLWMCALLLSALPAQAADPIRIGVTLYRQSDTFISLLASDLLDCGSLIFR